MRIQKEIIPKDVIEEIIALGEGYKTEFLESLSSIELAAQTICAFSNTKGGNIFIGINDKGLPIGIFNEEKEASNLEKLLYTIIPEPVTLTSLVKFNKKTLILIRIDEGPQKPYYVKENESFVPYIRVDNLNVPATKKAVKRFVQNSSIPGTGQKLNRDEKIVLDLFGQKKKLSIEQISKTLNFNERRLKKILRNLSKKSLIIPDNDSGTIFYYNSNYFI